MASLLPLLLAFPALIAATPLPQQSSGTDSSACAKINAAIVPVAKPDPTSSVRGRVPAQLAWDCLQSIPLNASAGIALVDSLKPYVDFQSTLNFLERPPSEYAAKVQPAIDVLGRLDEISEKLKNNEYKGEYEVRLLKLSQFKHLDADVRSSGSTFILSFRAHTTAISRTPQTRSGSLSAGAAPSRS
jgi:hypothetical protein